MNKCDICEKESQYLCYKVSHPHLITRAQQNRGIVPSRDKLLRVCNDCNPDRVIFHDPESGYIDQKISMK